MLEHHLPETILFWLDGPTDCDLCPVRSTGNAHCPHFLPVKKEATTLNACCGCSLHCNFRSAERRDSISQRTALWSLIGIFRESHRDLHLLKARDWRNRDIVTVALSLSDLRKVMEAVLGRGQTIFKPAHPILHACPLEDLCEGLLSVPIHDEGQFRGVRVRVGNRNLHLISLQDPDILGVDPEA